MRRLCAVFVTAIAVFAFTAVPAGAQPDGISDLPTLGFEIDPDRGYPGDTVEGWVDTDDVAEHCITDPVEFVAQFVDPEDPLGFETSDYYAPVEQILEEVFGGEIPPDDWTPLVFAYAVMVFFPLGLALDLPPGGDGELVEGALFQTFVMAFADIETAEPHEPRGNFNPFTGEGSTPVPELEPGLYPVIATCVALDPDRLNFEDMVAAMELAAAYIAENIPEPYPNNALSPEFAELAGEIAPVILEELVEPQALGIQFYCILQPDGLCATPPDAVELAEQMADEELAFEDEPAAEAEIEAVDDVEPELSREPVTARPAFTG